MARADVIAFGSAADNNILHNGGGTNYVILANNGAYYLICINRDVDVVYTKSTDGGLSWSNPVVLFTGASQTVAVWYGRWSGVANDKIYVAYIETATDDILFRSIDTASADALSSQTTVFDGATTTVNSGALSIVLGRDGALRVAGSIDAGTEDGAWSSTDDGATWADAIADPSEGGTNDQYFLLPGWNADTADVMLIFVDASANGLSVKRYDDSANTWTESAIIADGSFIDTVILTSFPHVACCVDVANSRNIVAAWTAVDAANADLRLFFITDTTITESTANVVLNSTDDQGLCAVGLDTSSGTIYVFYGGKSDGSETFSTAINIYYKTTTDDGATWSAETKLTSEARSTPWLACTPRFSSSTNWAVAHNYELATSNPIYMSVAVPSGGGGNVNLLAGKL